MTDRTQNQEPSMEEILASIRRIIAEEDGEEGGAAAQAAPAAAPARRDDREDVLDLIDVVEPDPFDDPAPEPEPDPGDDMAADDDFDDDFARGPSFAASADDDMFDDEPKPAPAKPAAAPAAEDPWDMLNDADDEAAFDDPEPEPQPAPEPRPAPRPQPAAAPSGEGLMSQAASAATVAAFASLGQALVGGGGDQRRPEAAFGGRTLEDLVADILRPLLKDWLDHNLPPMVEQLVREEIQRLVERSLRP
ncbi:DUF2497 domain-containing protein [Tistrella bauzanensis]|uniref:DUF2497 domain-containing protein n=1 Tax=Tistrella arctica TaxID=3133430 RepID=A0ABU9YHL7_9PROT